MVKKVNKSSSSQCYSSTVDNTAVCNKTVCTVDHVIKASNETKTSLQINKFNETWIIDSEHLIILQVN